MLTDSIVYLVDTNVFIYALIGEDQLKSERSRTVMDELAANKIGSVSTQILNETFSVLTRGNRDKIDLEGAEAAVNTIASEYEVFNTTIETVLEAIRGVRQYQLSYWDSLIWAAARLNDVPYVLSEDFSNGQTLEAVTFLNPLTDDFALERQTV